MNYVKRLESLILLGSDLRILLKSSQISPGEVQSILRAKGIFARSNDKRETVPLLSSTILTPDEFTRLVDTSVSRESSPKQRVATLSLTSADADWKQSLIDDLKTKLDNIAQSSDSYEIVQLPTPLIKGQSVVVQYSIDRKDFSKDWIQRDLTFHGTVEVSAKGAELFLEVASTHSSTETDRINRKIVDIISQTLYSAGVTTANEAKRITFESFTNPQRVRFFNYLSVGKDDILGVGNIDNVEIVLDPENPNLPDDTEISWMKDIVKSMRIDGDKLNEIFLLQNEKFYDYFSIQSMDVDYPFTIHSNTGTCRVTYFFPKPSKSDSIGSSELSIEHARPKFASQSPNEDGRNQVMGEIRLATRFIVDAQFARAAGDDTNNIGDD